MKTWTSLLLILCLATGCVHVDQGTAFQYDNAPAAALDTSRKYAVAVMPFTVSPEIQNDQLAHVHQFERNFLAARLASRLGASPIVSDAFVVPESTPAADFQFGGQILKSDGRTTSVEVTLYAGDRMVWKKPFEITLGYSDFGRKLDPSMSLWSGPAHEFEATVASSGGNQSSAFMDQVAAYRAQQYAGGKNAEKVINSAVDVERRLLLAPLAQKLIAQSDAVSVMYINWQRQLTRAYDEHNIAKTATIASAVDMTFSLVTTAGLGAVAMSGKIADMNSMNQLMQMSAESTAGAIKTFETNGDQSQYLAQRIVAVNTEFTTAAQPVTVLFLGISHKLTGTYQDQLQQFRRVVLGAAAKT